MHLLSAEAFVSNSTFHLETSKQFGGAVSATAASKLHVRDSRFSKCGSPKGAVGVSVASTANFWDSKFEESPGSSVFAHGGGAAVLMDSCELLYGKSHGLHLVHNDDWTVIRNTRCYGHTIVGHGACMYMEGSSPFISHWLLFASSSFLTSLCFFLVNNINKSLINIF